MTLPTVVHHHHHHHHPSLKTKSSSIISDGSDHQDEEATATTTKSFGVQDASASSSSALSSTKSSAIIFAIGFFGCMVIMELALEGANESFRDLDALPYAVTLFQFGCCFLLPCVVSRGKSLATFPTSWTQAVPYISLSTVVFGSTCLATMAVRHVSYPTKVVFKSAKLIPTMIVATVLQPGTKSYTCLEYTAAALLCAGVAGYGWGGGSSSSTSSTGQDSSVYGISLLLMSVFCDAFTPNIQQRLMASTTATPVEDGKTPNSPKQGVSAMLSALLFPRSLNAGLSAGALMTNANGVGCLGLLLYMAVGNFTLIPTITTCISNPLLLMYLTVVGMALATAVLCYTHLIQQSGSVVAVAVATLRKVATVVLSYVVYPKPLSLVHVASGLLVLAGILLSTYSKQSRPKK